MRSDAFITVDCDVCQDPGMAEQVQLTALARAGWDERNVSGELHSRGWRVEGEKDICPNCVEDEEGVDSKGPV
jgi:hypothetical protein